MKSRTIAALLVLAATTALAATAGFAAVTAAPDPAQMALLARDIPNSKVKGTRIKPGGGYVAAYAGIRAEQADGSSQLLYINSEVSLAAYSEDADRGIASLKKFVRSTAGPPELAKSFSSTLGAAVTKNDVTIGKLGPRRSVTRRRWSLTVRTKRGTLPCRRSQGSASTAALVPRGRRTSPRRPRLGLQAGRDDRRARRAAVHAGVDGATDDRGHAAAGPDADRVDGDVQHDTDVHVRVAALRRRRRGVRRHRGCDRTDLCRRAGGRRHHAPRHGHGDEPLGTATGQSVQTAVVT